MTAYYVVSESLTNAAKYADTPVVDVAVAADGGALRVEVRDDGRGGADPAEGSGLLGLRDRVEAIGGTMRLTSPPGAGTSLRVELPLVDQDRSPLTTQALRGRAALVCGHRLRASNPFRHDTRDEEAGRSRDECPTELTAPLR